MSSVKLTEGLASAKARAKNQKDEYLKNLKLASKLVRKQDADIKEARLNKKLGIPEIKALEQYQSAEEKLGDMTEQVKIAMENALKIFKFQKDAAAFVNGLSRELFPGTDSSELQLFNRYFPSFSKDIQKTIDPATLTPALLKQLWNQYADQVFYFERPNQVLDFKNPAGRIAFQKYLYNYGELLKDRAAAASLSSVELGKIISQIEDAVLDENKAFLDELSRKLGARETSLVAGPFVSVSVPSKKPLSATKKKAPVGATPSNITEFNQAVAEILDEKFAETEKLRGARDIIAVMYSKGIDNTLLRQLFGLVSNVYSKYQSVIFSGGEFQRGFRNMVVILEMARGFLDGTLPDFNDAMFNVLIGEVGARQHPEKIRDAITGFIVKSTAKALSFPAPTVSSAAKPGVAAITPAKVQRKHKRTASIGSGVPRSLNEKVVFGEIMSGNNNKKLQSRAIKILNRKS